jgi:hypothetical protein
MTQREQTPEVALPRCRTGHRARYMLDARRLTAGGGHSIECPCGHTSKHADFNAALHEWCRKHGAALPKTSPQRALPLGNVTRIKRASQC